MTDDKKQTPPAPQKKGLFRRKPKVDADGNPIYVKKKKMFETYRVNRTFAGDLVLTLFLLIGGLFMTFPLVYMVSNSLKPLYELFLFPPTLIVQNPTFSNYEMLFNYAGNTSVPMMRYIANSIFLCAACTLVTVVSCSAAAYAVSKREFKAKGPIFELIQISLMFAAPASSIVNYIIVAKLPWAVDSYFPLILQCVANALYMYMIKNFMDTFPNSVLEAARIDGAREWRVFLQILMPACKSSWVTVVLFCVQAYWGMDTGYFVYKEEMKGIKAGFNAITTVSQLRYGVQSASGVVLLLVPLITFIITQSNVKDSLATSGMKD